MRYLLLISFFIINIYANEATCEISKLQTNSKDIIICKYKQTRVNYDKDVYLEWIEPNGKITRSRKLTIPAGHGSVYDYRYLQGRTKGIWKFVVTDGKDKYMTTFKVGN